MDLLFWMRAALAVVSGLIAGFLVKNGSNPVIVAVSVAPMFYIVTYYLARYVLAIEVPASELRKLVTTGLGSFVMLFLFTWILYNTLLTANIL